METRRLGGVVLMYCVVPSPPNVLHGCARHARVGGKRMAVPPDLTEVGSMPPTQEYPGRFCVTQCLRILGGASCGV